jgi:RNA polymerase sigma-70 factor (ECF subfamily)
VVRGSDNLGYHRWWRGQERIPPSAVRAHPPTKPNIWITPALSAAPQNFDYEAALASCARGDRDALHRIYQLESRRLLGVALRIVRERALAEDVLHDAFMNIWNKAASFDAVRGSGRGWIHSIVRNQALSVVRTNGREVSADEEAIEALEAEQVANAAPMTELFEINADIGRLDECLQALDAPKRNSILAAYLDGCSHSEIAAKLNAPLGSVKAWIKRGLLSLRECMA